MKRASLKVTPAAAPPAPADLTDRLLDREAERPAAPAKPKRRAQPKAAPSPQAAPAPAIEPEAPARVPVAASNAAPPPALLEAALAQAQAASQALEAATQAAPARYSVALRYRLEALAHHLRQVTDFVARLNVK